jgi:hypothetical protein
MALILKDRVQETSTTTGTGTFTLNGAVEGFSSFSVIGDGNTTYYSITSQGTQFEIGIGTYTSSGTTLSRDTVLASSNSNNLVNFSAGTKNVFVTYPAGKSVNLDSSDNLDLTGKSIISTSNGNIVILPNGTGKVSLDGIFYPSADGSAGQFIKTDGSGVLSFASAGISWQSVQTTGFTAVTNRGYPCNTTSAAFTVTLPSSASVGDQIAIVDYAGTFATNNITLNPNGNKINGATSNKLIISNREGIILTYIDSTQGWVVTTAANDGTLALAGVPGAPTIGTATATGATTATVSFTAPASNGGFTITSYTATSSPGNITGTLSQAESGTITVTGLTGSTNYTFTVTATNSAGTSAASAASNQITTSAPPYSIDFLVIAGGGGGGKYYGGGGGAGGYRTSTQSVTQGTVITVTVGDGGAGSPGNGRGSNGADSSISGTGLTTITSTGGGAGGGLGATNGNSGGSGGGGGSGGSGGAGNTPSTSPSQGNNGESGSFGRGGGGSGEAGGTDGQSEGGDGTDSSITGSSVTRAGGGGGSAFSTTNGGTGGGGNAASDGQPAGSGSANTGSGGGGGSGPQASGSGGKGVVILSVPTANYSATTTGSPTVTTSGSNTIMQFDGSGSYTT